MKYARMVWLEKRGNCEEKYMYYEWFMYYVSMEKEGGE